MTKDMTEGAIPPLLVGFTIPLVLGNLFQLLYNAVDSMIVGKFVGETALAAVGTSSPLMTLAILFISGMCMGGIWISIWRLPPKSDCLCMTIKHWWWRTSMMNRWKCVLLPMMR